MSEGKVGKESVAAPVSPAPPAPAQPAAEKPASAVPRVPKEGLPTLVRPMSAEQVVSRLPRPPVPLPPPSEPRTLIKGEAVKLKLPMPPVVASRPPPSPPPVEQVEAQELPQPSVRTTSAPPPLPRTGFMTAVDSVRPLLEKTRHSLAPAIDALQAVTTKAAASIPAPAKAWVRARLEELQGALPPGAQETLRRRPRLLPVVAIVGLVVSVGLLGLVVSVAGRLVGRRGESARSSSSTAASAAASAAVTPAAGSASTSPCTVSGRMHVVAPSAIVAAGVEAHPLGDGIALGFASSEHDAAAVRVAVDSAAVVGSASAHSDEAIRRVRPLLAGKDGLTLAVDVDAPGDRVRGRRTLPLDPPLQAGAVGTDLVWARPGGPAAGKLWSLDGSLEDLDALRAASETSGGATTTALTFRRGNAIFIGAVAGTEPPVAKGPLSRIGALGPAIGSPTLAVDDGVVMLAWADRPSPEVPWRLRMTHVHAGDAPTEAEIFTPPAGGPGGHAMSPSLAALPGRRFLLVWNEGPVSQQRVRGITLSATGEALGKPLEISVEGVNSGQGQAAVLASPLAPGLVAFLQASKDGFEVAVTPIACGL